VWFDPASTPESTYESVVGVVIVASSDAVLVPSRYSLYPVIMSVAAVQVKPIADVVDVVRSNVRSATAPAIVVSSADVDGADSPEELYPTMRYEYVVPFESPVSLYEVEPAPNTVRYVYVVDCPTMRRERRY
jgi:hypothetical protein